MVSMSSPMLANNNTALKKTIACAKAGLPQREIDYRFLGALQAGIPNTSGVALGVDRLIMIALGAESIKEVISFSVECA